MKKLMIIAAAAAMTFAVQAEGLTWQNCENCGGKDDLSNCDVEVFKVTASGKAVVMSKKGGYKKVGKLKVKKGALALIGTLCPDLTCCYDTGVLFANVKAGNDKFEAAIPVNLKVWSAFGKKYDLVKDQNWRGLKKSKKVKLESAIYISAQKILIDGDADLADSYAFTQAGIADFVLEASAFGKATVKVYSSKDSKTVCGKGSEECGMDVVIKSYSGWFVGYYPCLAEDACFTCQCGWDPFGGTWKASYSAKYTGKNLSGAQRLAGTSFSTTLSKANAAGESDEVELEESEDLLILDSPYAQ